jgi:hypothetical protein
MSGGRRVLVLAAALGLGACASFHPAAPREFAVYGKAVKGPLKAISPEGILFTVRSEKNEPKAGLAFWREAMKTHMSQSGYRIVEDTSCSMGGAPAGLLKLAAPVGNRDYLYWIAFSLSPSGKDVLVAEAAGEAKAFRARSADIAQAISATAW